MTHSYLLASLLFCLVLAACVDTAGAADEKKLPEEKFNYDEANVKPYTLPDPLKMQDSRAVTTAKMWQDARRPELLNLFRTQVYGQRPPKPDGITYEVSETTPEYLHGKGTRKDVRVFAPAKNGGKDSGGKEKVQLLAFTLFTPKTDKPVPAFLGIHLFDTKSDAPIPGNVLEADVGRKLPGKDLLTTILDRGYAIATIDPDDLCPDDKKTYRHGALEYLYPDRSGVPGAEEPGAIAVWAWGLSRALDYLETDPAIDSKRVAAIGHSRRGKTALWAGAEDERFAIVISNDSGCGGAALSRRIFGETVNRINHAFPHWFCGNFKQYNGREDALPVDQHELIALSAPRPVYVGSAVDDGWADPKGEFLGALGAEPVYKLFGLGGLGASELPPLNQPVGDAIGYHIRSGKHALTDFDWLLYLEFADRHYGKSK
jgi:hypothetical protein